MTNIPEEQPPRPETPSKVHTEDEEVVPVPVDLVVPDDDEDVVEAPVAEAEAKTEG